MTGPHWKPRADELRANYVYQHKACDTAIIEERYEDACDGCRHGNAGAPLIDLRTEAALNAVRSGSDQTVELRAQVVLLETELATTRAQLAAADNANSRIRSELHEARAAMQAELADMRARFEVSQLLADQSLKELARVTEERDTLETILNDDIVLRTHDNIQVDKAIRPRGVTE